MIDREYRIGDAVEVIMAPDSKRFEGVLTDWDRIAVYINGLGYPWDDVIILNPLR